MSAKRKHLASEWLRANEAASARQDSAEAAGHELYQHLLKMYVSERLTAKDFCIIAHFHVKSGGKGERLQSLAMDPDKASKNASATVKLTVAKDIPDPDMLYVQTVAFIKSENRRGTTSQPIRTPSNVFEQYVNEPTVLQQRPLRQSYLEDLGDKFYQHPLTRKALQKKVPLERIRPVGIYFDGVQYTNNDSFLGISVNDILTGLSFLCVLIRATLSEYCLESTPACPIPFLNTYDKQCFGMVSQKMHSFL